jgi:hypothetical protein
VLALGGRKSMANDQPEERENTFVGLPSAMVVGAR